MLCAVLSRFSHVQLFVIPWTTALQASLSMGILQARILDSVAKPSSRGIFPTQESGSPALQADSLPTELPGKPANNMLLNHWCITEEIKEEIKKNT